MTTMHDRKIECDGCGDDIRFSETEEYNGQRLCPACYKTIAAAIDAIDIVCETNAEDALWKIICSSYKYAIARNYKPDKGAAS